MPSLVVSPGGSALAAPEEARVVVAGGGGAAARGCLLALGRHQAVGVAAVAVARLGGLVGALANAAATLRALLAQLVELLLQNLDHGQRIAQLAQRVLVITAEPREDLFLL